MNLQDRKQLTHIRKLLARFERLIEEHIICHRVLIIYEKSLNSFLPEIKTKTEVHVRCASPNDIKKIAANFGKKFEKTLLKRLEDNDLCFVAEGRKGEIAGHCWVAFQEIYLSEIDKKMELTREEADLYDAFVFPEYRGKKIYQKMLEEIFRFLKKKHYMRAYGHALSNNIPSRRGIARVGYKPKKVVTLLRLFGLKIYIEKTF